MYRFLSKIIQNKGQSEIKYQSYQNKFNKNSGVLFCYIKCNIQKLNKKIWNKFQTTLTFNVRPLS